jgi:SpoIID/LytB domain protein
MSRKPSTILAEWPRRESFALLREYVCEACVSIRSLPYSHLSGFSVAIIIAVVFWLAGTPAKFVAPGTSTNITNENRIDQAVQEAAANALGQREGTIIVMDPRTGRVRAVVNPQVAFENSFAPGSTIKPFVALAALRAGLIDRDSRTRCRERYSRKDFQTVCAHPRNLPALNPTEAIAYSCNYYFGTLGERLDETLLSDTLASFGFGKTTGVNTDHEQTGKLLRGLRDPRNALGEGEHLQVTPIQLITAYSALVNGGELFTPKISPANDYQSSLHAQLQIALEHRLLIIEGLRGAVRYGTAVKAGSKTSEQYLFGKTGTSTPLRGYRTQGWFVGFASDSEAHDMPPPERIDLAVLVLINHSHGADAAGLARSIFEEYARLRSGNVELNANSAENENAERVRESGRLRVGQLNHSGANETSSNDANPPANVRERVTAVAPTIKIHLVHENITRQISLDDYVLGVIAGEDSIEDQPEALKAMAIAVRTYAIKNLGRHAHNGYDFCSTTHCQRFIWTNKQNAIRAALFNAVKETSDQVLVDNNGRLIDSYFGASCGGATANMQTLWGATAPSYLQGVSDESCEAMPHHAWTDVISSAQLLKALRSDPRTNVGRRLDSVIVSEHDATGRAQTMALNGERQRTISGWDFKIIVGRALGWNKLKSSRFDTERSGSNYIFRGSGFGHGLGLCQEGAHVMAQRGSGFEEILAKYFPGTTVRNERKISAASLVPKDRIVYSRRFAEEDASAGMNVADQTGNRSIVFRSYGADGIKSGTGFYKYSVPTGLFGAQSSFADLLWSSGGDLASHWTSPQSKQEASSREPLNFSIATAFAGSRNGLSSEHFKISFPDRTDHKLAENILNILESTRADLLRRVSASGLSINQFPSLDVFVNDTTGNFVGRTGQPWWAAAAIKGNHIELQPLAVLQRRGVLAATLRHELVHAAIDSLSHGRAPRWLAEGMALYFAGEGTQLARYLPRSNAPAEEIEKRLERARTAAEMRAAYAAAYLEVRNLIKRDGEAALWKRVAGD